MSKSADPTQTRYLRTQFGVNPAVRQPKDFYATPIEATRKLLNIETFDGLVLEPACGDGAISKVLSEAGLEVESSDLYDWGYGSPGIDFLERTQPISNIITNPPYSLSLKFISAATRLAERKVALLFPVAYLQGIKRSLLFEQTQLTRVLILRRRPGWKIPGVSKLKRMVPYAWFVWDFTRRPQEHPILFWI